MPLSAYGTSIRSYEGTGRLRLRTGPPLACSYEAGQLSDGEVLVLSRIPTYVAGIDAADSFTGRTANGWTLVADLDDSVNVIGNGPDLPPGTYLAHRAQTLRATAPGTAVATTYRYGIVNFRFFGTNTLEERDAQGRLVRSGQCLDLQLADARGQVAVYIEPLAGYSTISTELSTTRGVAVTCEAVIDVVSLPVGVDPDAVLDDLCLLLSVARGTRVQWLYRFDVDSSGREIGATHINHITRRYHSLEPLDHRAHAREHTKRFVEGAYAALPGAASAYELRRALVPAWIDTRSEDDFLEMRGVQLAVVAEMIKAQHQNASAVPVARPWTAAWLRSWLRPWRRRRHPSFANALRAACRDAGYHPSRSTIACFVASRNRLVHVGRFRSDPAARDSCCRFPDQWAEYMFMVSFIDRFFLHLLHYKGPFIDWSKYPQHEQGRIG